MAQEWLLVPQAIWLMLPAYVANMTPVFAGGGTPIDFGRSRRGARILGDGKTWRGLAAGILAGTVAAAVLHALAPVSGGAFSNFGGAPSYLFVGLSLSCGALLGDLAKSLVKRRLGKARGERWFPADQLDFVLGAWALTFVVSELALASGHAARNWFVASFSPAILLIVLLLTPLLHLGTNALGYTLGKKEVPW